MDFLQMKYMVAIAESESMTKAAQALHVSQSALSLSYKRLEAELGVKLFLRDGRTLQLTPLGKKFRDKARVILGMVEELEKEMTQKKLLSFHSEVGDFTNEAAMLFLNFYPAVEIHEVRENADNTIKAVLDGESPFAVTCQDYTGDSLISELILDEPMYAFVNEKSPLAQCSSLTMEDFRDKPLIIQQEDYSIAKVMLSFFSRAGILPGRRFFVNDPEAMSLTVYNGAGQTFIPESIVNLWRRAPVVMAPGTKMIPMEEEYCHRQVFLTYSRGGARPELAQRYMDFLRQFGYLTQRLADIPNPMEMSNYAKKYWPQFLENAGQGEPPRFACCEELDDAKIEDLPDLFVTC